MYTFQCWFQSKYISETSRHLVTSIKEHVPKCVENFIQIPIELKSTAIKNATNRSVISERLVNNPDTLSNGSRFRILWKCYNNYDVIKLEAILIKIKNLKLNKQKVFDYVISLFK